jgi:chloride channel 3/4/5
MKLMLPIILTLALNVNRISDLPYLDAKVEYIHESSPADIMDVDAPVISLDVDNTIGSLKRQLSSMYSNATGGGFPIVGCDSGGGLRMYGYIACKELEHGLARSLSGDPSIVTFRTASLLRSAGHVHDVSRGHTRTSSEVAGAGAANDFSWLVDSAPLVLNVRSPLELVHQVIAFFPFIIERD